MNKMAVTLAAPAPGARQGEPEWLVRDCWPQFARVASERLPPEVFDALVFEARLQRRQQRVQQRPVAPPAPATTKELASRESLLALKAQFAGETGTGMSEPHETVPVKVWADVDKGIAGFVRHLNTLPGIRTTASCQGTLGEGGHEPYGPYVMVHWNDEAALALLSEYRVAPQGEHFGYVYPPEPVT